MVFDHRQHGSGVFDGDGFPLLRRSRQPYQVGWRQCGSSFLQRGAGQRPGHWSLVEPPCGVGRRRHGSVRGRLERRRTPHLSWSLPLRSLLPLRLLHPHQTLQTLSRISRRILRFRCVSWVGAIFSCFYFFRFLYPFRFFKTFY